MNGGLNSYLYARTNPIIYIDRLGLETAVITVRDSGFGTHSAIHVDNGPSGAPFLYDPAGSYQPQSREPRGSGDFFEGKNVELENFKKFHEQQGSTVEITKLPTTPAQEQSIAENAIQIGGSAPFLCTLNSSAALGGICGINSSSFPGSLAEDAANAQCK